MKDFLRRRLALFLVILLVFPTILSVVPAQTVSAATLSEELLARGAKMKNKKDSVTVIVEAGQQFYAGDQYYLATSNCFSGAYYVPVCSGSAVISASAFSLVCSSNKPSVASVEKKTGLVTTKKPGNAVIKMKIGKKLTVSLKLTVKKAGSLGMTKKHTTLNKVAKKLTKNSSTATIRKTLANFRKKLNSFNKKAADENKLNAAGYSGDSRAWLTTNELMVPLAGRYAYYETLYNPLSPLAKNSIVQTCKPKKVTASSETNTLTITLRKAVTKDMILWLETFTDPYKKGTSGKTFYAPLKGWGINTANESFGYYAKITAGSKKLTIYPVQIDYATSTPKVKKCKLKKGDTLTFESFEVISFWWGELGLSAFKKVKVK